MILLAIDTATASCSVAVAKDDRLLGELRRADGQTHSRHLMVMVADVLARCGFLPSDVDALAVSRGPGSFTGLRIGMATAKGLAAALGKPLVGVESLDALALQAPAEAGFRCCLIDARKNEVYGRLYRPDAAGRIRPAGDPFVADPDRVAAGLDEPCLFIGNGAVLYRKQISQRLGSRACFAPEPDHDIRAGTVAGLGFDRLSRGKCETATALVPLYIRKSDAELSFGFG